MNTNTEIIGWLACDNSGRPIADRDDRIVLFHTWDSAADAADLLGSVIPVVHPAAAALRPVAS